MKKSFVLYHDIEVTLDALSDSQAGKFIKAIVDYAARGEVVETDDDVVRFCLLAVRATMDRDAEKYAERCGKNRENGALGGLSKCKRMLANGSDCKQSLAMAPDSVNVSVNDSVFKTSSNSPGEPEGVEQPKPAKKPKEDRPAACPAEKWEAYLSYSRKFHEQRHEALGNRAPFTEKKVLDGAKTLDLMCRVRGIDPKEIQAALAWAIEDSFWNEQVRALGSLLKIGSNGDTKYANILTAMAKELVRK